MTYTYRGGKKSELAKRPDAFVARSSPRALQNAGICDDPEPVSSASCRVRARAYEICAPTSSHAYFRMQLRGQGITTTTGETGHLAQACQGEGRIGSPS